MEFGVFFTSNERRFEFVLIEDLDFTDMFLLQSLCDFCDFLIYECDFLWMSMSLGLRLILVGRKKELVE